MARSLRSAMVCATALTACPVLAQDAAPPSVSETAAASLEQQFQDPPTSARPRVWWHWMNGNVTKEGIAKDLAWMKRVGIAGMQNFDANLSTPQIVAKRLVYMTPEWKDAFRFTAQEADRLGLELAIAASPGWSETGGPWVKPEDGLKKLVWSETDLRGGRRFAGKLASPPRVTGPFQTISKDLQGPGDTLTGINTGASPSYYFDIAVLALPIASLSQLPPAVLTDGAGRLLGAGGLADDNLQAGLLLAEPAQGPAILQAAYPSPQTIRSARIHMPGTAALFTGPTILPQLEASNDGRSWRRIAELPLAMVPTTVAFAPVSARYFRVVFSPVERTGFNPSDVAPGVDDGPMAALAALQKSRSGITIGDFRLSSEDRIDRAEAKAAYTLVPDYFALSHGTAETLGADPGKVIDLTSRMRPDGTIDWTPPPGNWRVLRLGYSLLGTTNHPATPEATGLEVDKFDASAVRRYLEHYLGMYKEAAGPQLLGQHGVRAILTDSIEVGAANWTPRLIEAFKRARGYDPTPWLPALTGLVIGSRARSDAFLYDFRRTLSELMASEHYGTVATVAHENGLLVYGEALEGGRPSLGDDMAMRRYADVPMSALWTWSRSGAPQATHVADMKGAASVAHVWDQSLVAAESMTAAMAPWAYGPADLKRIIDLEFVTGVNRPVIHTSVHVPTDDKLPGLSLAIFGQYFNRNEAWAELANPWIDYIARNSLMLQQGRNVADVGYFYGEEAPLTGLYGETLVTDAPRSVAYDFVNADALMSALRNEGADLGTPGGARYQVLYLGGSARRLTLPALRKLAALVEGGATVVGPRPLGDPGQGSDKVEYSALADRLWNGADNRVGKGRVIDGTDIEAALVRIGVSPDFRYTGGQEGADIPFLHRKLTDGDSYFLLNRKNRTEKVEAHFRVTGKAPELWHAETGKSEPVSYRIENGETIVPLVLAGEDSVHVVFRKPTTAQSAIVPKVPATVFARLDGPWSVAFQHGRGAPASAKLPELAPLDQNADAGIRYFSGIATYGKNFQAPRGWQIGQPLSIDLGEAREVAEVFVNGKSAGYAWRAPYKVEIGALSKPGRNRLEVRVANLWVNRLIGDAQPGVKTKITWTPLPTYKADAPLRRSGLIGPVTLTAE